MSQQAILKDSLLVLDDTPDMAELVGELATRAGFSTTVTTDIAAFNSAIEQETPAIIVLDLQMPGTDGIEVLRQLSTYGSSARILLVTGMDSRTVASAESLARNLGLNVLGAIRKPFEPETLMDTLAEARSLTGRLSASDLADALKDSALTLRFQPVVRRLGRRKWHAESVEALPRWQHERFGLLTPAQFMPLIESERSKLMHHLTDFVMQAGVAQLQQWQRAGHHIGLRINVASGLITDTDFPDRFERFLNEHEVDPELLTLEIGNTAQLPRSTDGIEILTRLRLKGVQLSLDDFGDEGAPLNVLYRLPVGEVKIDRCITADLATDQGAVILFRGLVSTLRELGVSCCAEGVESVEQLDLLDGLGCDLAQGFHIATPLPAADVQKALAAWTVR